MGIGLNAGIGVEVLKYLQISATFNAAMTEGYKFEGTERVSMTISTQKTKAFQ